MAHRPLQRDLDIVLYGASGFTGRLVARYLARHSAGVRVGLAGRSLERLRQVRDEVSAAAAVSSSWDPPLLECEASADEDLLRLAARSRVVISTAGPFSVFGTPLVGACAAAGTHYVDINGETPWVRGLIDRFDSASSFIVPNCGYTVPSDLGVLHAVRLLAERHDRPARSVRGLMQFNGKLSGGTMSTGILLDCADEATQAARRDPFLLGGVPPDGPRPEDTDPASAEFDASLGCWTAPFWMADISSRVVRRSSALFREIPHGVPGRLLPSPYAPTFGYRERALAKDQSVARNMASPTPPAERRQRLIDRGKLPSPGQGPSEEVRARSWFRLFMVAEAAADDARDGSEPQVLTSVSGGDPGYDETSKMVAEAALLLACRPEELPCLPRRNGHVGGVVTPAFALGAPFVDALCARGIDFQEHRISPGSTVADEIRRLSESEPAVQVSR